MDDELVKEKCKMAFKVGLNHSGMSIQELRANRNKWLKMPFT